ncbi:helix-turn-helix transcriptional regulator [Thermoflavifilum thermophilum]|uniref:Predicted DNA-binding transcriptional regulator YafY, contains an HTH and WYL domains n=1 Tax=Thermoflavifilum thermophilum TaxID=1393122 RepID=A0A1I7N7L6_9BACT|nr:WYL domain-containing protein [Thermoflavifilum thermophilum]SFV30655.1 Predicted DNA-binding transcriptional regulator YafY, contains an HTH and WYL domains [Thermoflavifilum thermophilum]
MPLNKNAMARYKAIDERLRRKDYPSLEKLVNYVSQKLGKSVSVRTIQKDLYDMRYSAELNFKAPIDYHYQRRGYYYKEPNYSINSLPVTEYDLNGLEIAINILEHFKHITLIRRFEDAIRQIADAVKISKERLVQSQGMLHIDLSAEYAGARWIEDLAEAIVNRNWVKIKHKSYQRNEEHEYRLAPYHIREYQHRFYVVGMSKRKDQQENKVRIFGLDRITNIWPTRDHFDVPENFEPHKYFANIIGISNPENDPEDIELWFDAQQCKYVLNHPIHASQQLLEQTEDGCRVRLKLVINYELMMLLLSYGSHVKVLSPAHLARQIQEEIQKMAAQYAR